MFDRLWSLIGELLEAGTHVVAGVHHVVTGVHHVVLCGVGRCSICERP